MKTDHSGDAQKGFTLIEVIAVLVLVGILASVAGVGLATGVRGYLLASENAAMTQKAQLAMARLSREIRECFNCGGASGNIVLPYEYENHLGNRQLSHTGDTLELNGKVLVDRVADFTLTRDADQRITIELEMSHQQATTTKTFTTSILPRNL